MLRFELLFCYKGARKDDDRLRVFDTDTRDLYCVTMKPSDFEEHYYKGYLTHERLMDHLDNILQGLQWDTDPFEHIQLNAAMTPSVMYHVADLDIPRVRELILDTIHNALRFDCTRVASTQ